MAAFIPAAISGIGSIISGITGSKAAKRAADQQQAAAREAAAGVTVAGQQATEAQNQAYQGGKAALQPFYNTGLDANQALASALGLGGGAYGSAEGVPLGALTKGITLNLQGFNPTQADIMLDPGIKFRMDLAQRMIENSAAAKGNVLGGGTLKALEEYSQGLASSEYGKAWERALTKYNTGIGADVANYNAAKAAQDALFQRLFSFAQGGLPAAQDITSLGSNYANQTGNIGMTTAANVGNLLAGGGNARAAGTIGSNNAWQNALGQLTNNAQQIALGQLLKQGMSPSFNPLDFQGGDWWNQVPIPTAPPALNYTPVPAP